MLEKLGIEDKPIDRQSLTNNPKLFIRPQIINEFRVNEIDYNKSEHSK